MRGHFSTNISSIPTRDTCDGCGLVSWLLPATLSSAESARIESVTEHRRSIKRGHYLIHAGDSLTSLYVVNSGSLKTSMPDESGRAQLTGFPLPGEIVGLEAIDSGIHPCDVTALEDTSCCGIHYTDLIRLTQSIPLLQHYVHRALSSEIGRDHGLMLMLGSMTAEERLVVFLLNLSKRYSARGYSASQFRLSMTREDIGSYLGLRLETVSRLLTRFANEQILDVDQKNINIKNLEGLKRLFSGTEKHAPWPKKNATNVQ